MTFGLQDLNAEFANTDNASYYINSSFGIPSTIPENVPSPIFPITAIGLSVNWDINDNFSWKNIIYSGEVYDFDGKSVLVIGGAYSVDKEYRIIRNLGWWKDEQPSKETKEKVLDMLDKGLDVDIVLTHTCPYKYLPYEVFL